MWPSCLGSLIFACSQILLILFGFALCWLWVYQEKKCTLWKHQIKHPIFCFFCLLTFCFIYICIRIMSIFELWIETETKTETDTPPISTRRGTTFDCNSLNIKKTTTYWVGEIQVLIWERNTNVAGLNAVNEIPTLPS